MEYDVGSRIGKGGCGEVYKCVNEDGYEYAIKFPLVEDSDDLRRFQREIRIHSTLNHNNIVPIIEEGIKEDIYFYVMPLAISNLEEYLKNNDGNEEIFRQITEGVIYAHENGIIHRDLNPRNILLFNSNDEIIIKISDFGLGKFSIRDSTTITETGATIGTFGYMAPEQLGSSRDVDHRADIFALGKILYRIFARTDDVYIIDYNKVPNKYHYIIHKACSAEKDNRFQSVKDLIQDLDHLSSPYRPSKPSEMVQNEIKNILAENNFGGSRTENLAKMIAGNLDDRIVLREIFPRLPEPILESLINYHLPIIFSAIYAFDKGVDYNGGLPWSYCDVVADFYYNLYKFSDSYELKDLVIKRLPPLGYYHNRFHVGRVVGKIVDELEDENLILMVRDVLETNTRMLIWYKKYFDNMPIKIRELYEDT